MSHVTSCFRRGVARTFDVVKIYERELIFPVLVIKEYAFAYTPFSFYGFSFFTKILMWDYTRHLINVSPPQFLDGHWP